MGDGGGCGSSNGEGEVKAELSLEMGETGDAAGSEDLALECRPDLPDLMVSVSDLSPSPLDSRAEVRGLSLFPDPGILDLRALKDLVESLVSDLLKEGSDCRLSAPAELLGLEVPLPSLEG